jgi:hypothetical protein
MTVARHVEEKFAGRREGVGGSMLLLPSSEKKSKKRVWFGLSVLNPTVLDLTPY